MLEGKTVKTCEILGPEKRCITFEDGTILIIYHWRLIHKKNAVSRKTTKC